MVTHETRVLSVLDDFIVHAESTKMEIRNGKMPGICIGFMTLVLLVVINCYVMDFISKADAKIYMTRIAL